MPCKRERGQERGDRGDDGEEKPDPDAEPGRPALRRSERPSRIETRPYSPARIRSGTACRSIRLTVVVTRRPAVMIGRRSRAVTRPARGLLLD